MKSRRRKEHELEARLDALRQKRAWGWRTDEERERLSREIDRVEFQLKKLGGNQI